MTEKKKKVKPAVFKKDYNDLFRPKNAGECAWCGEYTIFRDSDDLCGCHLLKRDAKKSE